MTSGYTDRIFDGSAARSIAHARDWARSEVCASPAGTIPQCRNRARRRARHQQRRWQPRPRSTSGFCAAGHLRFSIPPRRGVVSLRGLGLRKENAHQPRVFPCEFSDDPKAGGRRATTANVFAPSGWPKPYTRDHHDRPAAVGRRSARIQHLPSRLVAGRAYGVMYACGRSGPTRLRYTVCSSAEHACDSAL